MDTPSSDVTVGREYALSLKQPWATLLAHGIKTIEVRRWPTTRRGRILIHAARIPDPRPEAWKHVQPDLLEHARQNGGIVGAGELTGCIAYRNREAFAADRDRHLNELAWFEERGLFGFTFARLGPLPFRPYPGWVRFFPVEASPPRRKA